MVKESVKDKTRYHLCEECGFAYKDRETAKECENYCKRYKSCSLDITRKSIKIQEVKS